jgi:hypothetical protein
MPQLFRTPSLNTPFYCYWNTAQTNLDAVGTPQQMPALLQPGMITKNTTGLFVALQTTSANPDFDIQLCAKKNGVVVYSETVNFTAENGGRRASLSNVGWYLCKPDVTDLNSAVFDVRGPAQMGAEEWYLSCATLTTGGNAILVEIRPINKPGGRPDA